MTRFVIRPPSIHRTPRLLAERLNADTRRSDSFRTRFDFNRDLFLTYPEPRQLRETMGGVQAAAYRELYGFSGSSKARQRTILQRGGVRVPDTATTIEVARALGSTTNAQSIRNLGRNGPNRFIVRPYRHHGGLGYRLTDEPTDFVEGQEYVQRVFPKDREYRVIYAYGDPVVTLLKRPPEGVPKEAAWNHQQGASFQTVTKEKNDRLKTTDFYESLAKLPIINYGHIIAADVLWSDSLGYVVCELNTCPGLTIPSNLERIANHVEGHRQSR